MGLAIVRRIVERHHGKTWVASVPGQGSSFHVALPVPA
jgi:signal transduction histidine kinase